MVKVEKFGSDTKIRIDDGHTYIWITYTEARQLIADIMAALGEPMEKTERLTAPPVSITDLTTQAYQEFNNPCKTEFPSIRDEYATASAAKIAFERDLRTFVHLHTEAQKRGMIK